jgi:hypothetical protein
LEGRKRWNREDSEIVAKRFITRQRIDRSRRK